MKQLIAIVFAFSALAFIHCSGSSTVLQKTVTEVQQSSDNLPDLTTLETQKNADGLLQHILRINGSFSHTGNAGKDTKRFAALHSSLRFFRDSRSFYEIYSIRQQSHLPSCPCYIVFRSLII